MLGVYDTEHGARIAQADALFQILCTLGRDLGRLNAITVTPRSCTPPTLIPRG